jgi:hypothetical protein
MVITTAFPALYPFPCIAVLEFESNITHSEALTVGETAFCVCHPGYTSCPDLFSPGEQSLLAHAEGSSGICIYIAADSPSCFISIILRPTYLHPSSHIPASFVPTTQTRHWSLSTSRMVRRRSHEICRAAFLQTSRSGRISRDLKRMGFCLLQTTYLAKISREKRR